MDHPEHGSAPSGSQTPASKSSWKTRRRESEVAALGRLGRFELRSALGKGAFGEVWRAYDPNLDREVALKVPRFDDASGKEAERFFREARAAAQLHHPNIVAIHDAGDSDGQFYIASELIEGLPLSVWLKENTPSFEQTAEIIRKLAEALHYAHSQGIFHRDIKPANVMISSPSISGSAADGDGETPTTTESDPHSPVPRTRGRGVRGEGDNEPHLMDFGLARRPDQEATMTMDGALVGTPSYMSPEQAGGKGRQADARSDIYSLGVVLYEMLVGRKPFDGPPPVVMHKILTEEPEPPRKIDPKVPRDLETICLNCLAKEPERRYPSAQHLADELQRWLKGEPIQARPIKTPERLWRWCRRNPVVAGLTAAVAMALLVGTLVSIYFGIDATQQAESAKVSAEHASREQRKAQEISASLALDRGLSFCEQGDVDRGLLWLVRALELLPPEDKDLEHTIRANLTDWCHAVRPLKMVLRHGDEARGVAFSADDKIVISAGKGDPVRFWDAETGKLLDKKLRLATPGEPPYVGVVTWIKVSPDGRLLLTGSEDKTARLWDMATGKATGPVFEHPAAVHEVAFSPDGKRILTGCVDEKGRLWDIATGKLVHEPHTNRPNSSWGLRFVSFSPSGKSIVTSGYGGISRIWDTDNGKLMQELPADGPVAITADGKGLFAGGTPRGNDPHVWQIATKTPIAGPLPDAGLCSSAAFDAESRFVVMGRFDGAGVVCDVATLQPIGLPMHHAAVIEGVAFSRDGRLVGTASGDKTVRLWHTWPRIREAHSFPVSGAVAFVPDSDLIWVGSYQRAEAWSISQGRQKVKLTDCQDRAVVFGQGSAARAIFLWERGGKIQFRDALTGKELRPEIQSELTKTGFQHVAFSPDQKYFLASNNEGGLFDAQTGRLLFEPIKTKPVVCTSAFSPDSRYVVLGDMQGMVYVCATATGKIVHRISVGSRPTAIAFAANGKSFQTVTTNTSVCVWDVESGKLLRQPLQYPAFALGAIFSPDGSMVLTSTSDCNARLWDLRTGKAVFQPYRIPGMLAGGAFRPDSRGFALSSDKGTWLYNLPDPVPGNAERVRLWVEVTTGKKMEKDGIVHVLDGDAWHERKDRLDALGGPPVALPSPSHDPELSARLAKLDPDIARAQFPPIEYGQTWSIPPESEALDDTLFQSRSHGDVKVEHSDKGWLISIPPEKENRDRFGRIYLPIAEGDFEITVTYQPLVFPEPKRPSPSFNRIALGLKSVMGVGNKPAIWHRLHEAGKGLQSMAFHQPEGGGISPIEVPAPTGQIERIRLTRHREYVKAEWAASETGPFKEVGRVKFDRAAALPFLETASRFTGDEAKVVIKDVVIRADVIEQGLWAEPQKATVVFVDDFKGELSPIRYKLTPNPLAKFKPGDNGLRMELDTTSLGKPTPQGQYLDPALDLVGDMEVTLTWSDLSLPKPLLDGDNHIRLVLENRRKSGNSDWLDIMWHKLRADPGAAFSFHQGGWGGGRPVQVETEDLTDCRLRFLRRGSYVYGFVGKGLTGPFQLIGMAEWKEEKTALSLGLIAYRTKDKVAGTLKRLEIKVPADPKKKSSGDGVKAGKHLTNSIGMKFVELPAGRFMMGSPANETGRSGDEGQFEVTLTKPFAMGAHEVTIGQFRKFVEATGYKTEAERDGKGDDGFFKDDKTINWQNPGWKPSDEHPVVCVSWNDAVAFCKWLSEKEKKTYRLPTEAEWEYACRAGSTTAYFFGDHSWDLESYAVLGVDRKLGPEPVGRRQPNAWEIHDMLGNTWEWCADYYGPYPKGAAKDPRGPESGKNRVMRGCTYHWNSPESFRSAFRYGSHDASFRNTVLGFRVVMEAGEPTK